ncbi:metalloreductase transmembrane component, putative [Talaromyces stipitatus ATCC 10500]|uniref:ferric-chelate reductase (NADPH) n=1 Tax=Talaromyces stipitatus (strain ATCC 10500 / CBS 375.48 / QM 6759 / NRRL 1006) TaxID=441959 RepID=B8M4S9_TALSN|nr:metalloreductase transmembrane component, putative [Talaromyces stipitatus ATCC 10500]EED19364.1 metalloreductase transmembrane component, putative [Talaromyces stipitatus ATCC 10500]
MAGNVFGSLVSLAKRINVPITASTTSPDQAEMQRDPWSQSGKYGLGWVYFSVVIVVLTSLVRVDNNVTSPYGNTMSASDQELTSAATDSSTRKFFPKTGPLPSSSRQHESSLLAPASFVVAAFRWIFYRPIPTLSIGKIRIVFPALSVVALIATGLVFVTLYCFVPQPLYYTSIALGSPPLAIRAGMIAVAMVPWITALGTKPNILAIVTGISHERLNVIHRWLGYLCLFMSLVHMIPFYITPVWEDAGAYTLFSQNLVPPGAHMYIYGSGIAAFVPLAVLCVHSFSVIRSKAYELFAYLHGPIAVVFLGMLIWHTKNFLLSWNYIWATIAVWFFSYCVRGIYLNWFSPLRFGWLIGEECSVTILPGDAVKVTIPTEMRWRPGQFVYLRMPGISPLENHPFTIASLCSDDFPSNYGPEFRDMVLVFQPFGGFTKKVMKTARRKGPYKIYRAMLDGPYGGMQRELAAFDDVVFFAGGSGITAIASQLLNLIKKMRDGHAVTKTVRVVWALRRPETMEWFKEELRICREYAPPSSVFCNFYLTGTDKDKAYATETVNEILHGVSNKRNSAWIREAAGGDLQQEKELRRENEDDIAPLPGVHLAGGVGSSSYPPPTAYTHYDPYAPYAYVNPAQAGPYGAPQAQCQGFNFGFQQNQSPQQYNYDHYQQQSQMMQQSQQPPQRQQPPPISTTTSGTRNTLTRFAFLPRQKQDSWRTEYGRPNLSKMLQEQSKSWGRRTCVFVCGPPSMRVEVATAVARLQHLVMTDPSKDEIFLHAENYAI